MSVEENKAIVRRHFEDVLNKQNLTIINEIFAADFLNHSPRIANVGREATGQDFTQIFQAFPDRRSTIEEMIAEGDKVFVRTTVQGTHQGKVPGIPIDPTGKQITWTVWEVFRCTGGKIVERWGIHNLREQLAAVTSSVINSHMSDVDCDI
jgi:C-1 hydroxylase